MIIFNETKITSNGRTFKQSKGNYTLPLEVFQEIFSYLPNYEYEDRHQQEFIEAIKLACEHYVDVHLPEIPCRYEALMAVIDMSYLVGIPIIIDMKCTMKNIREHLVYWISARIEGHIFSMMASENLEVYISNPQERIGGPIIIVDKSFYIGTNCETARFCTSLHLGIYPKYNKSLLSPMTLKLLYSVHDGLCSLTVHPNCCTAMLPIYQEFTKSPHPAIKVNYGLCGGIKYVKGAYDVVKNYR